MQHKYVNGIFDKATELDDGATTFVATGVGEVDGSAKILDLMNGAVAGALSGVGVGIDGAVAYFKGDWWVSPGELEFGDANETYDIYLQFSNDPTFASGIVNGPKLELGDARNGADIDQVSLDPQVIGFDNRINGVNYRYARTRYVLGGTSPSYSGHSALTKAA